MVIHLGTGPRAGLHRAEPGDLAPYSKTASGLSALGRAQARTRRGAGPSSGAVPVFGRDRRRRRARRGAMRPGRARSRPGPPPLAAAAACILRTVLLVVLAVALVAVAAAVFVVVQLRRSVPGPVLHTTAPATTSAGGPVPALSVAVRG